MSAPVLVALLAIVTGCGSGQPDAKDDARPVPALTSTPTAAPDGDGELVPEGLTDDLPPLEPTTGQSQDAGSKPPGRPAPTGRILGADVSWPQCPKGMGIPEKPTQGSPMPTAAAKFVILGLTNGPSFTPNPCLTDQLRWVKDRHLLGAAYAVHSTPDTATLRKYGDRGPFRGSTRLGALSNAGYSAAGYNVASMRAARLFTPIVWIDVEPVPRFDWGSDTAANAAVIAGAARGYTDAGYTVGYYSTPALWRRVVGTLRTGAPEWRAAGQTSMAEALSRCGPDWSFQGGEAVFGQWVEDGRDRNVTCPGASTDLGQYFYQY
ncbi:MAG: hypothetical protein JWQ74_2860 [Marmoricola sp.]|nr:hypothetical protein [Marmoricola sp.]